MAYGVVGVPSGHPEVPARVDTTSEVAPGFAGTFTAIDDITTDNYGHITGVNTKTITMPYETDFAKCSPSTIQAIVQNGQAANYWSVGDSTPITLNGEVGYYTNDMTFSTLGFQNETYYAFILGFDHNSEIEGENTLHLQVGKRADGVPITFCDLYYAGILGITGYGFVMNETFTSDGGWQDCYMRNTICEQFFNALPASWQNIITPCTKYTNNTGKSTEASAVTATQDKIFIPNCVEAGFDDYSWYNKTEADYTKVYSYYETYNIGANLYMQPDIFELNAEMTAIWWLRSPGTGGSGYFAFVDEGECGDGGAYVSIGFAPCFVIS